MRRIVILLDALPLSLWCAFRDGLREEGHELADGAFLVEGEAGEVGSLAENGGGTGGGSEDDGEGEDLHGFGCDVL